MVLQKYDLKLEYIEGKKNIVADTLSRAPEHLPEQVKKVNGRSLFIKLIQWKTKYVN